MPHQGDQGPYIDPASGLAKGVVEGLTPSGIGGIFEKLDPQALIQMLMRLFGGGPGLGQGPFAKGGAPTDPGGSAFKPQSGPMPDLKNLMTQGTPQPLPPGMQFPAPIPQEMLTPGNPAGITDEQLRRMQELIRQQQLGR